MGSIWQIPGPSRPEWVILFGELRSLPCNEIRLGGFVRDTENTREEMHSLYH